MPASGRGCASPEHTAASVSAPWQGRTLQTLPAVFRGYLQMLGRAWRWEEQQQQLRGLVSCTSAALGSCHSAKPRAG